MGEYVNTNNENIRNWLRDAITLTEPSQQNESMSGNLRHHFNTFK